MITIKQLHKIAKEYEWAFRAASIPELKYESYDITEYKGHYRAPAERTFEIFYRDTDPDVACGIIIHLNALVESRKELIDTIVVENIKEVLLLDVSRRNAWNRNI
jgi:hypothetical protein